MGSVDHRVWLTPRHRRVDLVDVSFLQANRIDYAVRRRRLSRRPVGVLVVVRAYAFADPGLRRQPHRRGARLWNLFFVQPAQRRWAITRFMAIAAPFVAGIGAGTGDDCARLFGARADAVSRFAPDGGILRARHDLRLANRGFLVSRTGSRRYLEKRGARPVVRCQFRALAVVAPAAVDVVGGWAVRRFRGFRRVAAWGSG